jgi:hypothetical protein
MHSLLGSNNGNLLLTYESRATPKGVDVGTKAVTADARRTVVTAKSFMVYGTSIIAIVYW